MNQSSKLFLFLNYCLFSLSMIAYDPNSTREYAQEAIKDYPNSVQRLMSSAYNMMNAANAIKEDRYSDIIADWTGGFERAIKSCITKHRYLAAWKCYGQTPEQQAEIIQQAQADANACLEQFEDYKKALQAYNIGNTKTGSKVLEKLANQLFQP